MSHHTRNCGTTNIGAHASHNCIVSHTCHLSYLRTSLFFITLPLDSSTSGTRRHQVNLIPSHPYVLVLISHSSLGTCDAGVVRTEIIYSVLTHVASSTGHNSLIIPLSITLTPQIMCHFTLTMVFACCGYKLEPAFIGTSSILTLRHGQFSQKSEEFLTLHL
jgi:hypothetical protein